VAEGAPDLFAHQPPPRADGRLPITITYLEMVPRDWTQRGRPPDIDVVLQRIAAPTAAFYRELYDRVGRPWLWYERRLLSDANLQALLEQPGHELHVARHDGDLVGYIELAGDDLAFFGLTLAFVGRRIGPWLLDRAVERAFARGTTATWWATSSSPATTWRSSASRSPMSAAGSARGCSTGPSNGLLRAARLD